jgi:hypothetical protein
MLPINPPSLSELYGEGVNGPSARRQSLERPPQMPTPAPIEPLGESEPLAPIEGGRLDEDHVRNPSGSQWDQAPTAGNHIGSSAKPENRSGVHWLTRSAAAT